MSSEFAEIDGIEFTNIDGIEWEHVARKIFYECLATSSPSSSISSLSSLSTTTSRVSVRTLVDYIRENASGNYRNKSLLDELQKSIEEVSWDGQVNYQLFKKASRRWIARIQCRRMQDGNNNTPKADSSNELLQSRSDDEKQNSMDSNDDTAFEQLSQPCRKTKTPRRFATADFVDLLNVSSYSPSSDTTNGCAMSDSTADDTDSGCGVAGGVAGDLSQVDLRLRVCRFDEENALLREEIVRAEENAAGLQRQLENLRRKLDRTKEKCRQLEHENDEHQEILNETEQKERECRLTLQKVEKEKGVLARKLEDAETERQQVTVLNAKLECCKKEKFEFIKEATICRWEFEEKQKECELLKDQLAHMTETNKSLQESYAKTIQCLRDKIQAIKDEKFLLQTLNTENLSDQLYSIPPIGYFHPHKESTPCDNSSVTMHDSLYDELKASGFSVANESRIRELEDDLCWYNEEIGHAISKINDVIEQICDKQSTPHIPDLHLDDSSEKTSEISSLFQKISELSNMVNEIIWKPKVKDASSQLCVDSQCANEKLTKQFGILSFEDHCDFLSEKSEYEAARKEVTNAVRERDVFVEAFSMNSRLLGEYVEEVEIAAVADDYHGTDKLFSASSCKGSMSTPLQIREDIILKPIVQELDRIIECTNNNQCEEESTLNSSPSKNPRYRCIYTCAQPSFDQRTNEIDDSKTDSTLNSTKGIHCDLAATYVVSSGGDGFPPGMAGHTTTNGENTVKNDRPKVTSSCVTTSANLLNFPKRKISVFHRSFDIDTMQASGEGGVSDIYRLTERSMSTPTEQDKTVDDRMELDPECMKMTPNTRKSLLNYRTNDKDSDSSDNLSPLKSLDIHRDNLPMPEVQGRTSSRPILLAPPKLKLPFLKEIPPYGGNEKNSTKRICNDQKNGKIQVSHDTKVDNTNHETESTINETRESHELANSEGNKEISASTETSSIIETIRPGDEIERGVTYRKTSISRELNFSDYSLFPPLDNTSIDNEAVNAAKLESVSKVVLSSDNESTSCDSSPKREPLVVQATPKPPLLSTYQKPQITNRSYPLHDPLKSRDLWLDRGMEAGCGYQTRNNSTNVVSCDSSSGGGGGVGSGIRGQDEKANVVPTVALAMSSGEDSSDSECDPMAIQREDDDRRNNVVNETRSISPNVLPFVDGALLGTSTPAPSTTTNNVLNSNERDDCRGTRNLMAQKRDKRERLQTIRRSLSESGCGRSKCCHLNNDNSTQQEFDKEETRPTVFPSLADVRLQESGIANLANSDEVGGNLSEADLERKYTALSIGLVTDRVTLPRRMALSIRQRDQSEKNLACEFQKMQQDIQDLAPLCIDRESVEKVERVKHQLQMITQCAHRVSCTAETLGAVHQEHRISRAILLADRYLLVLRSRCEKLASDLAETKRILMENNIVVEEHNGELGDDMPRIRYRGMPTNNRTMMARRRASIATIFRPLGNFQDVTKDGLRQRNSVSGRVTLRRPSLSAESQKWEAEKLDRTDSSSSSIGELREIFEQAESRRNSREENNNNVLRLHSSNLSIRDCENNEVDVWTNTREEVVPELFVNVDGCHESQDGRRTSMTCWSPKSHLPWRMVIVCIIISFFFGFFVQHAVSSVNQCSGKYIKWWSVEEILGRYLPVKNDSPRPI